MLYLDSIRTLNLFLAKGHLAAVLFYSDACPFCIMARINFEVAERRHPNVVFAKVLLDVLPPGETDNLPFEIQSIPTLLVCASGKVVQRIQVYFSLETISSHLNLIATNLNERTSGIERRIKPGRGEYVYHLSLELFGDITQYRTRSRLAVQNVDRDVNFKLDRTLTQLLLFFDYARRKGMQAGTFRKGRLTDHGRTLIAEFKRDMRVNSFLQGIEGTHDKMYFAKLISRLNRIVRDLTGHDEYLIENTGDGYRLNDRFHIEVEASFDA